MDMKALLLLLADTNGDGKVNLSDLAGVVARVAKAKAAIEKFEDTLRELAADRKLSTGGRDVQPEELAQLLEDQRQNFADLGRKADATRERLTGG